MAIDMGTDTAQDSTGGIDMWPHLESSCPLPPCTHTLPYTAPRMDLPTVPCMDPGMVMAVLDSD